jgi:hypothetical protein
MKKAGSKVRVPSLEEMMAGTDTTEDDSTLYRERQRKIFEYEQFINERLKVDLELTMQDRDKIYAELGQ